MESAIEGLPGFEGEGHLTVMIDSRIPALVRFAELKEKRVDGLIAHAIYPISTGKLEGFNNKIKVAKRLAYGYRDHHFFFTLVRFLSIPFPNKT